MDGPGQSMGQVKVVIPMSCPVLRLLMKVVIPIGIPQGGASSLPMHAAHLTLTLSATRCTPGGRTIGRSVGLVGVTGVHYDVLGHLDFVTIFLHGVDR